MDSGDAQIPQGHLEAAWLACKVYNSALSSGELTTPATSEHDAIQAVISGLNERQADVPRRSDVAGFVRFHGLLNVLPFVILQSDGSLHLTSKANTQYLRHKFARSGSISARMAKRIIEQYQLAAALNAPGLADQGSVSAIVTWLEKGFEMQIRHRRIAVKIKPIPSELRSSVESCLRLETPENWLTFIVHQNIFLPENLASVDAVTIERKDLAKVLSCKLSSKWFDVSRDFLQEWRDEVQGAAEDAIAMAAHAVRAGNKDILAAPDVATILKLLANTAWGTGEGANAGYSIHRPSKTLEKALLRCLEIKNGLLIFNVEGLPNVLPESKTKRSMT